MFRLGREDKYIVEEMRNHVYPDGNVNDFVQEDVKLPNGNVIDIPSSEFAVRCDRLSDPLIEKYDFAPGEKEDNEKPMDHLLPDELIPRVLERVLRRRWLHVYWYR